MNPGDKFYLKINNIVNKINSSQDGKRKGRLKIFNLNRGNDEENGWIFSS